TNRLSRIFSKFLVLELHNYIAVQGASTTIPITFFIYIIEDAQVNNKELWALSQDMSKAYNTVHIPLLKLALQRIKVPQKIINLIINTFTNRTNKVIIKSSFSDSYSVQDGIDQGETIAPLLWRVYYDPLLTQVISKHQGYKMS